MPEYPTGMIISDDIEATPILDFDRYSETIAKIIRSSYPKFSIGIYGEWGTGKTTLMKLVENKLTNEHILTVWFNAWRYEREDNFALIALLKTIAYAMADHPMYKEIKPILLRGIRLFGKDLLRQVATNFITEKGIEDFENKVLPKMELLSEIDKDTIYFDGLEKIEKEMKKIISKYPDSRVIVFIDDLDRCSPKTTLEVFESIKVFLGIDGFVYVIGLSHETVSKLVSAAYKDAGIKGEQYIRKIIQIPIMIPDWNITDIEQLVIELSTRLNADYSKLVKDNKELISKAVELNPREVKRFINNFIVSYEIYSSHANSEDQHVKAKELLIVQALKLRWNKFYLLLTSMSSKKTNISQSIDYGEIKEPVNAIVAEIKNYLNLSKELRNKKFDEIEADKNKQTEEYEIVLLSYRNDNDFWEFLRQNAATIFSITNWEVYRRAVESVKEIPNDAMIWQQKAITALNHQKFDEALLYSGRVIEIEPSNADAWYIRAVALLKSGRENEALRCLERSSEINPRHKGGELLSELLKGKDSKYRNIDLSTEFP